MANPNYTAYEVEEGLCLEDVEEYCGHLTDEGSFTTQSQPSISGVERMLTASYYWIVGLLASNGYSAAQTDDVIVGILQELNALDVAIKCELANPITGQGEANERFIEFKNRRDELVTLLTETTALDALGAVGASAGSASDLLAAGGLSKSRKRSVESDPDYLRARFRRGFGQRHDVAPVSSSESDYYPA